MRTRLSLVLLAAAALLGSPAWAGATAPQPASSQPHYSGRIVEELRVPTPDGVIYGVIERPVVPFGMTVPVILTYSPYHYYLLFGSAPLLPGTHVLADPVTDFFVPRGYARAFFDVVGTGESGGCMDFGGPRESRTGRAVVEALAAQPWGSGKVGMIGASYAGGTQWATALAHPPHLTAIVPQVAVSSEYDYVYAHGAVTGAGQQAAASYYVGDGALLPVAATGGAAWVHAARQRIRPCDQVTAALHNGNLPNPTYDAYWKARDYKPAVQTITTPTLVVGSWADPNVPPEQSTLMWSGLPSTTPKRLVMGQAGHSENQLTDIAELYHAWFDHWLLGMDNGVMTGPPVVSVTQSGHVTTGTSWPPAGLRMQEMSLVPSVGTANTLGLGGFPAQWADVVAYQTEYVPLTTGTGPAALVYRGAPSAVARRISGTPHVELTLKTSARSTHVHAVLVDLDADGGWTAITRGVLNSRYRSGDRAPFSFQAGSTWNADVRMQPVDWEVAPGHALGLLLTSVNATQSPHGDTTAATNTVLKGTLRLPLRS